MRITDYYIAPEDLLLRADPATIMRHEVSKHIARLTEEFLKENPTRAPRVVMEWDSTRVMVHVVDDGPAPRDWVLVKNGMFYRPGAKGYTSSLLEAGRFTAVEALLREQSTEGVHARRVEAC